MTNLAELFDTGFARGADQRWLRAGGGVRFDFDVTVSDHDDLKRGIVERSVHRIAVEADRHVEASLTAAMVAGRHGMVTAVYDRI